MRRRLTLGLLGALALIALFAVGSTATAKDQKVLKFDTMTPVVRPFTGPTNAIREIGGGGIPWAIERGEGELRADGRLKVEVRGLVLAEGPSAGTTGAASTFIAAVNCLTTDSPRVGLTRLTPTVNAGAGGNAKFDVKLDLPDPCVAPIVFVGTPAGDSLRWFATTGN